jgi:hypothetical protein
VWTYSNTAKTFTFNASQSSDPEGRTLEYRWFTGGSSTLPSSGLPDCVNTQSATIGTDTWTCIGRGIVLSYTFTSAGSTPISLVVTDPGGLSGLSRQTVAVP